MRSPIAFACVVATVSGWNAQGRAEAPRQVTCANADAVYAGIGNTNYEMIFQGQPPDQEPPGLVGLLRMRKGEKTIDFRFKEETSNGLSRTYISLDDDEDVGSMIMRLNANFTQSLTGPDGEAAPFVITSDLAVKFYGSKIPDSRSPEMIPPETWKLVGCNKR